MQAAARMAGQHRMLLPPPPLLLLLLHPATQPRYTIALLILTQPPTPVPTLSRGPMTTPSRNCLKGATCGRGGGQGGQRDSWASQPGYRHAAGAHAIHPQPSRPSPSPPHLLRVGHLGQSVHSAQAGAQHVLVPVNLLLDCAAARRATGTKGQAGSYGCLKPSCWEGRRQEADWWAPEPPAWGSAGA